MAPLATPVLISSLLFERALVRLHSLEHFKLLPVSVILMSITVFRVLSNHGATLKKLENTMKKRSPINYQTSMPNGDSAVLKTTAEIFRNTTSGMFVKISYDSIDEYRAQGGEMMGVIKMDVVDVMFTKDIRYLLVWAGKAKANNVAKKVSELAFNMKDDPILKCSILPDKMERFLQEHNSKIISCGWKELNIPNMNDATIRGRDVENTSDFDRYDRHGTKHTVLLNIPSMQITLRINREASLRFYTKLEQDDQVSFVQKHVLQMCV